MTITSPAFPHANIFSALVMGLADLLVQKGIITREELEIKTQELLGSPELLGKADVVKAVAGRIVSRAQIGGNVDSRKA